jgi:hypothetical protein
LAEPPHRREDLQDEDLDLSLSNFWVRAWYLFSIGLGYEIWIVWDRLRGWT